MFRLASLALGAVAALGALAVTFPTAEAQPAGTGGSCFMLSGVQNTRLVGTRMLLIRAGSGAVYRMDFGTDCEDVGGEPLILHPVDNNDQICSAVQLNVSVRHTGQECNPVSLRQLSPDEAAAIPPKDRP